MAKLTPRYTAEELARLIELIYPEGAGLSVEGKPA